MSNASYIEHLVQGDAWKLARNDLRRSLHDLENKDISDILKTETIFNSGLTSEKVTIFKIFQKIAT